MKGSAFIKGSVLAGFKSPLPAGDQEKTVVTASGAQNNPAQNPKQLKPF